MPSLALPIIYMAGHGKALKTSTMDFSEIWRLLAPQGEYKRRRQKCEQLWQSYPASLQERIYANVAAKKRQGIYIKPNPYFVIEDEALIQSAATPSVEILSFDQYYRRYGTTQPQNGWRMENPTGQKVVYIR